MLRTTKRALVVCLLVAGMVVAASAVGSASAASRAATASDAQSLEGPILSVNSSAKTFKMNDHHQGVIKIKVNNSTRYHNLSGFKALHQGLKVDVEARHSNTGWIAVKIEPKHH